ncbi:hypothetical protein BC939DRAFT_447359 [Gamsiella multidivaricata]|uniref:uncharacterized protein n=1 Tax=Gamsiella multidivaricata TaxID=101098 RepID=UPI00221F97BD|nr:uncharacterized protein BC939DRAFT_447359 [Gamsiella multidivaricata]KAG0369991.1 hypothetical protein BGZ54_008176 [Gamsiella multidivaricata]KAI7826235.1 hypothetical protein BC939DRAFT_447359 [Gamsiella multidivaricata]
MPPSHTGSASDSDNYVPPTSEHSGNEAETATVEVEEDLVEGKPPVKKQRPRKPRIKDRPRKPRIKNRPWRPRVGGNRPGELQIEEPGSSKRASDLWFYHAADIMVREPEPDAREIAFLALDGLIQEETYRWPVREELLPSIPPPSSDDVFAGDNFERQGLNFVDDLSGVPKTAKDYSNTDSSTDSVGSDIEAPLREEELKQRKLAKQQRKRRRHSNERMANERLQRVHGALRDEVTAFARRMHKEARTQAGAIRVDGLNSIQERAVVFSAEDSLRRTLDRLPYVVRQGAMGEAPDYAQIGYPKPVASEASNERGWDTVMAAASISGIDDRILKRVSKRMKDFLGMSKDSRYYEEP